MSKPVSGEARSRFIEEVAALLVPAGMQPTMANLYAYLLLCEAPATLDEIAADLGMAKSSASTSARVLEYYGLARRHTERGSKRVRFGASESYAGYILSQARLMGDLGRVIEAQAGGVTQGDSLRRLRYLGSFYRKMEATITGRVQELADEFVTLGPDEELK